ncbi:hypothetical protein HY448_01090 [Candidatus Pacearchaeota archaeon]|nr:hypothetical protein [Candidatus Pacearchaeota archaeon]
MKNTTIFFVVLAMILTIGGFVFLSGKDRVTSNSVPNAGQFINGEIQKVVLSKEGFNYKDATAQAGRPIALSADKSVVGCLRSVVVNAEGKRYSKYLQTPEDILELPALSKGTYTFSCTMGMGYGKLNVK